MPEEKTIFAKVVDGEIPSERLYEDDHCIVIQDINPQAPVHILIVPNKEIATVNDIEEDDERIAGRMMHVAKKLAAEEGIAEDGFRLIINCNKHGNQEVFHLHMHLVGGRQLGRMIPR